MNKQHINTMSYYSTLFQKYNVDDVFLSDRVKKRAVGSVLEQIDKKGVNLHESLDKARAKKLRKAFSNEIWFKNLAASLTFATAVTLFQAPPLQAKTTLPLISKTQSSFATALIDEDSSKQALEKTSEEQQKLTSLHFITNKPKFNDYMPHQANTALLDDDSDVAHMPQNKTTSLTVIDTSIDDWKIIASNVTEGAVLLLKKEDNPLDSMLGELKKLGSVESLNIISHGSNAELHFGNKTITKESLETNKAKWEELGSYLSRDADIKLLGCNVAQGEEGKAFVNELAEITKADVAASIDATGSTRLGGNWELEWSNGEVEKLTALSIEGMQGLTEVLACTVTGAHLSGNEKVIGNNGSVYAYSYMYNVSTTYWQVGSTSIHIKDNYGHYNAGFPVGTGWGRGGDTDGATIITDIQECQVAVTHTVTFNANDGTGPNATGTTTAETASTSTALTTNGFSKTGYTFIGWNTAANGSGTAYAAGANYDFSADITLYAQWIYSVTFSGNLVTGQSFDAPNIFSSIGTMSPDVGQTDIFIDDGNIKNFFTRNITPSVDGTFTIAVTSASLSGPGFTNDHDTQLYLYESTFNPADSDAINYARLLYACDDIAVGNTLFTLSNISLLHGHTYTIVATSFLDGMTGAIDFNVTGPASVTVETNDYSSDANALLTFEIGNGTLSGINTNSATYAHTASGADFTIAAASDMVKLSSVASGVPETINGAEGLYFGFDVKETEVNVSIESGATFDLVSFLLSNQNIGTETFTITTSKGGSFTVSAEAIMTATTTVTAPNTANFQGITSFTITAPSGGAFMELDHFQLANITFASDTTAPTVTIASTSGAMVNNGAFDVTFTLSESSSNFTSGDVNVSNGSLSNFSGSDTNYTATITPSGTPVTINVAGATFTDSASNNNIAATQLSITINQKPTVDGLDGDVATFVAGSANQSNDWIDSQYGGSVVATITDANWDSIDDGRYILIEQTTATPAGSFSWWSDNGNGKVGANSDINDSTIVANGTVYYYSGGVAIGTVDGTQDGQNGNALRINLNSAGDITEASDILGALMFNAPNAGVYTFTAKVYDGMQLSDAVSFTARTAASVSNVTSSTANATKKIGDTVSIQVAFSQLVDVDTTNGTPRLKLETGTTDRYATYDSGSGTNTLTFTYTVQSGDTSSDLDYVDTSSLELNGGSITDNAADPLLTGSSAILTLAGAGTANSLGANKALVIDGIAPTFDVTPTTTNVAQTTLNLNTSLDENGTIYYIVVENNATTPTSAQVKAGVDYGSVTKVANGSIVTSGAGFDGNFSVSGLSASTAYDIYVTAQDDEGTPNLMADGNVSKVEVTTLAPPNSAPIWSIDNNTTNEDNNLDINLSMYVTDAESNALTFTADSNNTNLATISIINGILTVTPVSNASGVVGITLWAYDGDNNISKDINITIAPINDTPTINTTFSNISMQEDNGTTSYELNVSDIDGDDLNITVESNDTTLMSVEQNWTGLLNQASWSQGLDFNLSTVANANGIARITIKVNDTDSNTTQSFDVNVTAVNDAPTPCKSDDF